jgi:hypothetical protein
MSRVSSSSGGTGTARKTPRRRSFSFRSPRRGPIVVSQFEIQAAPNPVITLLHAREAPPAKRGPYKPRETKRQSA